MKASGRALLLMVLASVGCKAPTQQLTLELSTDANPEVVKENTTQISVGKPGHIESIVPKGIANKCDTEGPDYRIGSLVIVPSGPEDEEFGIKVVVGLDGPTDECVAPLYTNCIVARRTIRFLPQGNLILPVDLRLSCKNIPCGPLETCVRGECVPALVTYPGRCVTPGACDEYTFNFDVPLDIDGGSGGGGGGGGGTGGFGGGGTGGAGGAPPGPTYDEFDVLANGMSKVSNKSLSASKTYRLRASGIVSIGQGLTADAQYVGSSQTLVDNVAIGLAIDDLVADDMRSPDWGGYNDQHVYYFDMVGNNAPIQTKFHDADYGDNSGQLRLEIYELP